MITLIFDVSTGNNDLYGGIGGLIALQSARAGCLVADEALLALQHQDWPVDQVEVVPGQKKSYFVHFLEHFIAGKKLG